MKKKHILIIGDINSLTNQLNFSDNKYSLLTTKFEAENLSLKLKKYVHAYGIESTDEFDVTCFESSIREIYDVVENIMVNHGTIDFVVTTYEHTVLPAAMIRTKFNIEGLKESEVAVFRDKDKMKTLVKAKKLLVPDFYKVQKNSFNDSLSAFIEQYKNIVIKPLNQAASNGVLITNNIENAIQHLNLLFERNKFIGIEEFIEGPIMHFDGIIQNGEIKFISVSKKNGNCYDFINKKNNLTTIILNEEKIREKAKVYTQKCLAALNITSSVFHLEVFEKDDGFVFLEIAGRYPGGGVAQLIKKTYNFDFVEQSYLLDCQEKIKLHPIHENVESSAMILIPLPVNKNLKIKETIGLENLPKNIVDVDYRTVGEEVKFHELNPFNYLAKFFIMDSDNSKFIKSINEINTKIEFKYD